MASFRAILLSSRPLSWVNTAFPFAVAYYVASGRFDLVFWVGVVFFLIPYNLAMYGINDVFDYESDVRNPRKGGAEGALLAPELHRPTLIAAAVAILPGMVWLVALGSWQSWLVLGLSLFSVVAYSMPPFRWKEIPLLDSVTSSAHFVTPALYGLSAAEAEITPTAALALAAFYLWGMASHAFGAVQDVNSDREAGIGSLATALGARTTVWISAGLYVLAGVLMLLTPWPLTLIATAALPYLVAVVPFGAITDDTAQRAHAGWRWFLALNFVAGALVTLVGINAGYLPG